MELVKENIVLDKKVGFETTQLLLEGDVIVPDIKPDMDVILQTDAKMIFNGNELSLDRINFTGKLDINVLYLAKGSEKPVHSMSSQLPVDDFINLDGLTKEMWVELKSDITNIEYKMLNDRKISYRAIVDVSASAMSKDRHEAVINIASVPEDQMKKTVLKLNKTLDNKEDRFIIKDELSIPSGKPNIAEILQCAVSISNKEIKVSHDKVLINGDLVISTLYKGDTDESFVEFMEHELPFNGSIEVDGAAEDMFGDVNLNVNDRYFQVRPDADGEDRVLEIEVSVGAKIRVSCEEEIEILEDAHCINKTLDMKMQSVKYPSLVCRNKNQCTVKEVVQLDKSCPDMLQIFRLTGTPHMDDIKIIDDKIVVEGIVNADILYVAESDDVPLYSHNVMIPYRQVIETKGARNNADTSANVDVSLEHVGFNMLSKNEVEVRCLLNFNTLVTENKDGNIINEINFSDIDKSILDSVASMTIYVVQPNDSLWKIAKQYNTSIEELLLINDIENPNVLYPGQKLLILKKIIETL